MTNVDLLDLLREAGEHLATHRLIMDWDNKLMCSRCAKKDDDLMLDCKESPSYALLCRINEVLKAASVTP